MIPTIDRRRHDWPINAMNPCAPDPDSRTCHDYIPRAKQHPLSSDLAPAPS